MCGGRDLGRLYDTPDYTFYSGPSFIGAISTSTPPISFRRVELFEDVSFVPPVVFGTPDPDADTMEIWSLERGDEMSHPVVAIGRPTQARM